MDDEVDDTEGGTAPRGRLTFGRIWCLLGEHERSVKGITHYGNGLFRSHCERCGRTMVRSPHTGRWSAYFKRDGRSDPERRDEVIGPAVFVIILLAVVVGFILVRSGGL